jgi:hypothetical protein
LAGSGGSLSPRKENNMKWYINYKVVTFPEPIPLLVKVLDSRKKIDVLHVMAHAMRFPVFEVIADDKEDTGLNGIIDLEGIQKQVLEANSYPDGAQFLCPTIDGMWVDQEEIASDNLPFVPREEKRGTN